MCCGRDELLYLKEIIDSKLRSDFSYGWIDVDEFIEQPQGSEFDLIKRQKSITDTASVLWD